jgi:putative tryptophan/tyrosine transport system substrate-binding protein
MRRREFITLLGGAAAVWPFAARAQQPDGMRRIGVLMTALESDSEYQTYISNLRKELQNLGWAEGRNLRIDYRWGALNPESRRQFAKEVVAMQPDVVFSQNTPTTATLHQQTQTVPIVFVLVSDPIGSGFVTSFPRPGGNITGSIHRPSKYHPVTFIADLGSLGSGCASGNRSTTGQRAEVL